MSKITPAIRNFPLANFRLGILLNSLAASIKCLHLRNAERGTLPSAAAAARLAAGMPSLSSLLLEGGAATDARNVAATSELLRALGPNLRTLVLHQHLPLGPGPPFAPQRGRNTDHAAPPGLLPDDLHVLCPSLTELRVQLRSIPLPGEDTGGGDSGGGGQRQSEAVPRAAAAAAAAATACFAGTVSTIAGLTSLTCLELRFPGLALGPDAAAALSPLAALSALTRLVLPIRGSEPAADPNASSAPPKSSHVVYGSAVRALLLRRSHGCRTSGVPPAPPAAQHLLELDLGPDLALTLPYLPYCAPALAVLRVGELSAESVPASQWDVVPEPPPPLPLELLSCVPPELWERVCDAGGGSDSGGGGGGGRPHCSLPLAAVRLPPRLQVRYLPDVAILAALAALPAFSTLECTAVRHPQGEICLDMASVGVPGPPDLGGRGAGAAGAAVASWLACMVAAAAGLLLRVLGEADWRRHPLTLRPSPFSFLRDGYSRLRWAGPHSAWMSAVAPLAPHVTRVRLKQMALQRSDVSALAAALPGLQFLELVRCTARRSDVRAWRTALGPDAALQEVGGADLAAGGAPKGDYEDMFGSSSDSSSGGSAGGEGSSSSGGSDSGGEGEGGGGGAV
ncbi:hypothetical protein PLESTB_000086900 [Pleodorina starrii]|uniref:Uncharacterized protein n=1 Tax=Pleodorina starrii TaxID=330485 RepID=A0A9W6BAV8_9CHLO|nr:hypothetical protein PLESTB_000086900 [Pleodorina starrii]GLC76555.1 hypothetical protein PLESTF_001797100 [Pleodorina starrii]